MGNTCGDKGSQLTDGSVERSRVFSRHAVLRGAERIRIAQGGESFRA